MASILVLCYGAMFAACAIVSGVMYRAADSVLEAIAVMRRGSRTPPGAAAGDAARRSARCIGFVPALVMHGDSDSAVNPLNADQIIEQFREVAQVVTTAPAPLAESTERRVTTAGRAYRQRDYLSANVISIKRVKI